MIEKKNEGIDEKRIEGYHVFPNPSNGILSIEGKQLIGSRLRVYDISGKLLQVEVVDQSSNPLITSPDIFKFFIFPSFQISEIINILTLSKQWEIYFSKNVYKNIKVAENENMSQM